jgi:cell division topological specificity factor
MSLFGWINRRGSAPLARERLKVLLAYERTLGANSDLVGVLREEILALIRRHVMVEPDKVQVKMGRGGVTSTLAIDIELPN